MQIPHHDAHVDLTTCDREPIHVPEHIQSHGVLLAVDPASMTVERISASVTALLGGSPGDWLGAPVADRLPASVWSAVEAAARDLEALSATPRHVYFGDLGQGRSFDVIAHVHEGRLLLEFDERPTGDDTWADPLRVTNDAIRVLGRAEDLPTLCDLLTQQVQKVLGYHRVMIYRFAHDWHGWVFAEARRPDLEPFLDLHYPASDIPVPARRLFLLNRVRMIPDVQYDAAVMQPPRPTGTVPLDMSYSFLRGVSPIHVEYLENMGVRATLTMGLQHRGQLWGMIACHHYDETRRLPYFMRTAAELITVAAEMRVAELLSREQATSRERTAKDLHVISQALAGHESMRDGMEACLDTLQELVGAGGFVVWLGEVALRAGEVPSDETVGEVVAVLRSRGCRDLFHTDHLAAHVPGAERWSAMAAGLLAIPVSHADDAWLLWFRPERRHSVSWAGEPSKPARLGPNGIRLTPRASFEQWIEEVRERSEPWSTVHLEASEGLRTALSDVLYRERERLTALNEQLAQRNEELDGFSAMASHDLREPLRAIANYARFLREDAGEALSEADLTNLDAIDRLVRRMYALIEGLLMFSRLGRTPLELEPVDLGDLVADVLSDLDTTIQEEGAVVEVTTPLPTVTSWRLGLEEILANLIGNAIKYSNGAPRVEVGMVPPGQRPEGMPASDDMLVLFVRDHGIGIDPRHLHTVFRIFHRLWPDGRYGKSTGIGLSIVRKIVERLGGQVHVESAVGEGSTFYFSLAPR